MQTNNGVSGNEGYAFDNANRLTARNGQAYTNDANGNTLTGGGRTLAWDSQNRLVQAVTSAGTSSFRYGSDGLRRRMEFTNTGGDKTRTDYAVDGQNVVQEVVRQQAAGQGSYGNPTTVTYLAGPSGPMYRRPANAADVRWYVYDGRGAVVGEVDPNGNLTASKKHDVYGATRGSSGTSTTKHGWQGGVGHQSDNETGLVYMRARYYDPALGRFASEDSVHDGPNWFTYCANDPINSRDLTGKTKQPADWVVFALLLEQWDTLLRYSPECRTMFAGYLRSAFQTTDDPENRQAYNILKENYAIAVKDPPKEIRPMGRAVMEAFGYALCLELTWWFLREDLGMPNGPGMTSRHEP